MYYLSRNKEAVAEARKLLRPERGQVVGNTSSSGVSFTTVGSFTSTVLGREVFLGIKEYTSERDESWVLERRAPLELATITAIAEHVVEGELMFGDFYPFFKTFKREAALARHPMSQAVNQVNRNMGQHTLRLGRDL